MANFTLAANAFALVVKYDQLLEALPIIVFLAAVGITILGVLYFVLHLVVPFSIRQAIEKTQNPAFGIIVASMVIGIAIIIAAAI